MQLAARNILDSNWIKSIHGRNDDNQSLIKYQHKNNRVRILECADSTWQTEIVTSNKVNYQGYAKKQTFDTLKEAFEDAAQWNTQMNKVIREAFERYKATGVVKPIVLEGGNAFSDVGTIHRSEIEPTLRWMEQQFNMKNLNDRVLGSVGKAEYSGDIDIAVDEKTTKMDELSAMLRTKLGDQSVTGVAGNVTVRVPIAHYDKSKDGRQPRTGFVQVDFLPGDPSWMKTFFHSPGDASKFKGIHRNMALIAVAAIVGEKSTKDEDDFGRPVSTVRWQWGLKNGLVKVKKTSRKNEKTGKWIKKQDTELLGEPVTDPKKIAHILFRGKAGPEALNSMETILDAVKKAYNPKEQDSIYRKLANTLSYGNTDMVSNYDLPKEVAQYIETPK